MMNTKAVMPPAMRYTIVSCGTAPSSLLFTLSPFNRVEEEEPLTTLKGHKKVI